MSDNKKAHGYMNYESEMQRLEQYPGLRQKWKDRPLETESGVTVTVTAPKGRHVPTFKHSKHGRVTQ
jgi:hypothetical protein